MVTEHLTSREKLEITCEGACGFHHHDCGGSHPQLLIAIPSLCQPPFPGFVAPRLSEVHHVVDNTVEAFICWRNEICVT